MSMEAGGQAQIQQSTNDVAQDQTSLRQLFEQKFSQLQSKLESESYERHQYANQLANTQSQLDQSKSENQSLQAKIESLSQELLSHVKADDTHKAKVNQIMEAKRAVESERDGLYKRIEEVQDKYLVQVEDIKRQMHQVWAEKAQVEIERDQMRVQIGSLESKVMQFEKEKEHDQKTHTSLLDNITKMQIAFESQCEETKKTRRELESLKREYESEMTSKTESFRKSDQLIKDNHAKIHELEKEINELRLKNDRNSLEKIQQVAKVTELENQLKVTHDRFNRTQNDYARLQRDYDVCKSFEKRLESDKQRLLHELNEIKEKYKSIATAKTSVDIRQNINDHEIKQFQAEFKKMFESQKTYPHEIEKLKIQVNERESQLNEYQSVVKRFKEAFNTVGSELKEAQVKLKNNEQQMTHQDYYIQSLRNSLEKRQALYIDMESHYQCLQKAIDSFSYKGEILKKYDQIVRDNPKINQVQLDKAREELINQDNLHQQLIRAKLENDSLLQRSQNLNETIGKLQAELDEREQIILELRQAKNQDQNQPSVLLRSPNDQQVQQQQQQQQYYLPSEQINTIQRIYTQDLESKQQTINQLRQQVSQLEQANFDLQVEINKLNQRTVFDPKGYISKDELAKAEEDLKKKDEELKQLRVELGIAQSSNKLQQMRLTMESGQKQKLDQQVKDLRAELDSEKKQVEALKKLQLDLQTQSAVQTGTQLAQQLQESQQQINSASSSTSDDHQFKALTDLIKQLRDEKEDLHRQLRAREVNQVQHDTVTHNLNIIIENLKQQIKSEQDKNVEMAKLIKFLQSNAASGNVQDASYGSGQNLEQRQTRQESSSDSSKTINELKELLMIQKDSLDSEIAERDRFITELQDLIIENDRVKQEQNRQQELRLDQIAQSHAQELQSLNERLTALQLQNAQLLARGEDLQRQIDTYMDERDKLLVTDEMKSAELHRLQTVQNNESAGAKQTQASSGSGMDPAMIRNYSERIDNIQVSFVEKEKEYQVKISDLEVQVNALTQERTLLNDEIDSLKEREALMKREVLALQQLLDKVKGASAQLIPSSSAFADQQNQMMQQQNILSQEQQEQLQKEAQEQAGQLILRERLNKAENEVESLRAQLLSMNQKNRQLQSEVNKMLCLAEKHAQKVEEINMRSAQYQHQLKMLDECNVQNQSLQEEVAMLKDQLEKAKSVKPVVHQVIVEKPSIDQESSKEIKQQVQQLSSQLSQHKQRYEELQKELTRQQETGMPGITFAQIQQQQHATFRGLYGTLQKARQIILAIYEQLEGRASNEGQQVNAGEASEESKQQVDESGVNEGGNIEGSTLGKRQRLTL